MEVFAVQAIEIADDDRVRGVSIKFVEPFLEGLNRLL